MLGCHLLKVSLIICKVDERTHKPVFTTKDIVSWVRAALVREPFEFELALDAFSSDDEDVLLVDGKVQHVLQVRDGRKARAEHFVLCYVWSERLTVRAEHGRTDQLDINPERNELLPEVLPAL
jgi:hypothetical protein